MIQAIFILFLLATLVQLTYWLGIFSRLALHHPENEKRTEDDEIPVSVIICARNEAHNLEKNLPHFLNQNYRSFELIVVNDHSTDHTEKVLLEFQAKNPILHAVSLQDGKYQPGKKEALSAGIAFARNEIILLSDADCYPVSPQWLQKMQSLLRGNIEIVLGYSPYKKGKGPLNGFIRFETIYTATQYFSFTLLGLPYMGVGRNLSYRKSLFFRSDGFKKHLHLASGDDDLFINEVAKKGNTTITIDPDTFVVSEPKRAWRGYYYQKSRHLSTGSRYRPVHQWMLGGLSASHFLHYTGAAALLFAGWMSPLILMIYLVRIVVVSLVLARVLQKLQDVTLKWWIPVLDLAFIAYYLLFAPALFIGSKAKTWKQ